MSTAVSAIAPAAMPKSARDTRSSRGPFVASIAARVHPIAPHDASSAS
jgi:hypothetical protein